MGKMIPRLRKPGQSQEAVSANDTTVWEIVIMVLSLYALGEFSIEIIVDYSEQTEDVIDTIDFIISLAFLGDFFYFFVKSKDKWGYFKRRWIDLISSIPFFDILRALRLFKIIRLLKVFKVLKFLRGVKAIKPLWDYFRSSKLRAILIVYVILLVVLLIYCSVAFYSFEKEVNPAVKHYFDAIWWSFITMTSVGYGDIYPITTAGRVIAIILSLCGTGLFSIITAELAAKFLMYLQQEKERNERMEKLKKVEEDMQEAPPGTHLDPNTPANAYPKREKTSSPES